MSGKLTQFLSKWQDNPTGLEAAFTKDRIAAEFAQMLAHSLAESLPTEADVQAFAEGMVSAYHRRRDTEASEVYNDDMYFDMIKPMVKQLIRFRDDTAKGLGHLKELLTDKQYSNRGTDYAIQIVEDVISGIDDMLLSYDVHPYRCTEPEFNPRRQRIVKTLPATTPEQARTVAESRGEGYERRGVVISKELVIAYTAQSSEGDAN